VTREYLRDELEELRTLLTDLRAHNAGSEATRADANHEQAGKKST
jgi:uncharacterized membrane protein